MSTKWQSEKDLVEQIQSRKTEIENLKFEAENAERNGDLGKVAEIRYGRIPDTDKVIEGLKKKLTDLQKDAAMVNEEVDAEEIAEVVSRWTGIPVEPDAAERAAETAQPRNRTPYAGGGPGRGHRGSC